MICHWLEIQPRERNGSKSRPYEGVSRNSIFTHRAAEAVALAGTRITLKPKSAQQTFACAGPLFQTQRRSESGC